MVFIIQGQCVDITDFNTPQEPVQVNGYLEMNPEIKAPFSGEVIDLIEFQLSMTINGNYFAGNLYSDLSRAINPVNHRLVSNGTVIPKFKYLGGGASTLSRETLRDLEIQDGDTIYSHMVKETYRFGPIEVGRLLNGGDPYIITENNQMITLTGSYWIWKREQSNLEEDMRLNSITCYDDYDDDEYYNFVDPQKVWLRYMRHMTDLASHTPEYEELSKTLNIMEDPH